MNMNLLRSFMSKHGDNQKALADAIGLPQPSLSSRMNGHTDFRQTEMEAIRKRYGLSAEDMQAIFFAMAVSNSDTIAHERREQK